MKDLNADVAIIGAGTAGLAAYRAAAEAGRRAVIIEGGPYGTTCARVGCMPSKLLIAAAEAAHVVEKWPQFGLRLEGAVRVDGEAVMARVRKERDRFVGFVLEGVEAIPAESRLRGYARFLDGHHLTVDAHTRVRFGSAVIATGSSPSLPPFLRAAGDRLVVNDDVFDWDDLPRSVAVFGAGVIGLELGQALHRLGVKVLMFGRNQSVGPFTDPDVRAYATRTFQSEFYLDATAEVRAIERIDGGVAVRYVHHDGTERTDSVDFVIAATGRTPNVHDLGLDNLDNPGVRLDGSGVPLFDRETMRCGDSNIYIAGDVNNDVPLLHEAADEGRIAGENAARNDGPRAVRRRAAIGVVFSDPQLAVVGAGYRSLKPDSFVTGEVSFENQGRSRVMLRNRGLLHLYADRKSGRLLGAEMMGPDAEHLAHLLAWAIQCELTVAQALQMPFYHPVVEEGLRTALRDADGKLMAAQAGVRAA